MVQELSPLHKHMSDVFRITWPQVFDDIPADITGAGPWWLKGLSCFQLTQPNRSRYPILIVCRENPSKGSSRSSIFRVEEVITSAINRPVEEIKKSACRWDRTNTFDMVSYHFHVLIREYHCFLPK